MAKFQNREEYEKWKKEKEKAKQEPIAITEQPRNQADKGEEVKSPPKPLQKKKPWYIVFGSLVAVFIIIAATYNFYKYNYKPKKVAEAYLKAVQLHDYETIKREYMVGSSDVLINLISWSFIDTKKIFNIKKPLDLSEEEYYRDLKYYLALYNVNSSEDLPYESFKQDYKSYDTWRSGRIKTFDPFKEDGNYYYIASPKVEYLLDITATNKLGAELKKKYILGVTMWSGNEWSVSKFEERE